MTKKKKKTSKMTRKIPSPKPSQFPSLPLFYFKVKLYATNHVPKIKSGSCPFSQRYREMTKGIRLEIEKRRPRSSIGIKEQYLWH